MLKGLLFWVSYVYRRLAVVVVAAFLPMGLVTALLLPPFWGPDEGSHWQTALTHRDELMGHPGIQCSRPRDVDDFFGWHVGARHPLGQYRAIAAGALKPRCMAGGMYGGVFAYPGVMLAAAVTQGGNQNGLVSLLEYYLARIFTGCLVFMVLARLGWLAATSDGKTYPYGLLPVLAFALAPLFIQQSFVVTADMPSNALALVFVSILLFRERLTRVDWLLFLGVGYFACVSKAIIFPAILPICLVAAAGGERRRWRRDGFVWVGLVLTLFAIFNILHQSAVETHRSQNVLDQLAYIKSAPLEVLVIFASSVLPYLGIQRFGDTSLGWFDIFPTHAAADTFTWMVYAALAAETFLLLLAVWQHRPPTVRGWLNRWSVNRSARYVGTSALATLGLAAGIGLIELFVYVTWSKVHAPEVQGLQDRYFFPFIITAFALLFNLLRRILLPAEPTVAVALAPVGAKSAWAWRADMVVYVVGGGGLLCYLLIVANIYAIRFY